MKIINKQNVYLWLLRESEIEIGFMSSVFIKTKRVQPCYFWREHPKAQKYANLGTPQIQRFLCTMLHIYTYTLTHTLTKQRHTGTYLNQYCLVSVGIGMLIYTKSPHIHTLTQRDITPGAVVSAVLLSDSLTNTVLIQEFGQR